MHVKAVLIDLDNTLYDYEKCNQAALDSTIEKLSSVFNKPKEAVRNVFDASREKVKLQLKDTASSHSRFLYFQKTIESLKGRTDTKLTQDLHNLFWDTYFSQMVLFGGAKEFLTYAKEKGMKIAIISDLTVDIQFRKIIKLGIDGYIDFIITSEEAGKDKPHDSIFSLSLEKLGVSKDEVMMIGDDEKDAQGAKDFGIKFLSAKNGGFGSVLESFKNLWSQ